MDGWSNEWIDSKSGGRMDGWMFTDPDPFCCSDIIDVLLVVQITTKPLIDAKDGPIQTDGWWVVRWRVKGWMNKH